MRELAYADTSSWEEWQKEYRYGAFYIFPPRGIIEDMDELRETYDPRSASICQAHVSLSEPLRLPMTDSDLDEIRHQLSPIAPFQLHYGPLRSFPPHPGVTYAVSPEDAFRRLRSAVHAASMFADVPRNREHIAPHITIAEFITAGETIALLEKLGGHVPEGEFLCDSIEYAVPNHAFFFERVLTLPLG